MDWEVQRFLNLENVWGSWNECENIFESLEGTFGEACVIFMGVLVLVWCGVCAGLLLWSGHFTIRGLQVKG